MKYSCAGIMGAFLLLTQPLWAAAHHLRDYAITGFERQGSSVIIRTSGPARLQVTAVSADTLRIWLDPDGDLRPAPSVSVTDSTPSQTAFTIRDEKNTLTLETAQISLRIQKASIRLDVHESSSGRWITGDWETGGLGWDDNGHVFLKQKLGSAEHFYGLGEDNDAFLGNLDRRGTRRDMWTGQEIRKGHVTADIPINFFMSTGNEGGGYGMFFDNSFHTWFDMGATSQEYWSWEAEGGEAVFYIMHGPQFSEILDRFTDLTGKPRMLPLWAHGFIQSKCCYWDWNEVDGVAQEMAQRKIPFDVLVIDYNWSRVPMDFQWADRWGTEIAKKLSDYEKSGRRFLLSTAGPMIRKDASNYQSALEKGLFAKDDKGHTVSCGHYGGDLLDFTHDGIQDWLWPQLKPLYEQGIDGWWLDLNEPEGEPPQTIYSEGPRAGVHNKFSLLNAKAYYEMQSQAYPRDRVFILSRTGFAGIQRYGTAVWTGDTWSDYATLMAHVPEALNTTISGIPYWTNDSGGFMEGLYKNNIEDHGRLYERWLQFSAYTPVMRVHHVGPSAPYMFGPLVEDSARRYINERYRLLPYIYSYSQKSSQTGEPLMRPLIFNYQDDPNVRNLKDEYLFGENLLIAPVLTEGAERRKVYFPEGRWVDQDYGHEYQGPNSFCVAAPRSRIPVFVRSGAIIPKAPAMQHTGEKPWDPLTLELYPQGASTFQLYQDDGETTDYATGGALTQTLVTMKADARRVNVTLEESNKLFVPGRYEIKAHLSQEPRSVAVNGQAMSRLNLPMRANGPTWFWDRDARVLSFMFENHEQLRHEVQIELDSVHLPAPVSDLTLDDCPTVALPEKDTSAQQIPQFWPPPSLPALVQAENYDKGGETVAYHDVTPGNQGGEYRSDDVDVIAVQDDGGGYAISNTETGEWYEYTVKASRSGYYDLEVRYQSEVTTGLHWEKDGLMLGANMVLPPTAKAWRSSGSIPIYLREGEQVLRLMIDVGGMNLNSYSLKASANPLSTEPLCSEYQGGYGHAFDCFGTRTCKKINEDWEHNADEKFWCIVHEW